MTPDDADAIRAAFEEGYTQGAYHPKGVSIIEKRRELSALFVATIRDTAERRTYGARCPRCDHLVHNHSGGHCHVIGCTCAPADRRPMTAAEAAR